jgi:hypothetical protein
MGGACSTNGEKMNAYRILWESQKERDHWGGQDVGGWTILKWIFERQDGMVWIGLILLSIGTSGVSYEHSIEPSGSIKCWEVLEGLDNWWLLKKCSAP